LKAELYRLAGAAIVWKGAQLGGVKILHIVRLLVLARLLAPEDFGLLAIATTASGFLLLVTDFGILPALVQRAEVDEKHYHAAWTLGFVRGLVITGGLVLGASVVAAIFHEPRAANIIRGLAIVTLVDQMASVRLADLARNLKFRSIALTGIIKALADTIVAIALAQFLGVWALVAGALAGSAAYTAVSYMVAPYRPRLYLDKETVRGLVRFGRWILLTGLVAVTGAAVLRAVISYRLGTVELGIYFLATKLAFLPAEIAKEVIGAVAFPLFAQLKADAQQLLQVFRATLIGMCALLIPLCGLIILLAPSLIQNLLGSKWTAAVPIIQVFAIASIVSLIGELTIALVHGLGQPSKATILEAIQSLLSVICALLLVGDYGLVGVAMAWLIGISISQGVGVGFTRRMLHCPFQGLGAPIAAICCVSLAGAVIALGLDHLVHGLSGLVAGVLAGLVIVAGLLWYLDSRFDFGVGRSLLRAFPPLARVIGLAPATP
jgi:lipopolysaccharide exporter